MKQNKQNSLKFGLLIAIITSSFAGSIVGLSIFLKKRHTYKATQSEREKLEKVSAHARAKTYNKKK